MCAEYIVIRECGRMKSKNPSSADPYIELKSKRDPSTASRGRKKRGEQKGRATSLRMKN